MPADPRSDAAIGHDFDTLPDAAFVRLPVVAVIFATSQSNVWRWAQKGILPKPRRLAGRTTAWNVGELRTALKKLGI